MKNTNAIIALSEHYSKATKKALNSVSLYSTGSGDTVIRLQSGKTITERRAERIIQWFSDNWPADLAWPKGIDRPAPTPIKKGAA